MVAQRSNTGSGDTPRVRDDVRIVIVDREPTEAAREIEEVMASCRMTTCRVSPASLVEQNADECGIAVVTLDEPPALYAAALEDVRRLKAGGFAVLCCGKGADSWTLGVRCRLLLSGALEVLDSTATDFARNLRQRVDGLLDAASERARERELLRAQMLGLGVVGSGPRITALFRSIVRVSALSDLPVLITGETGTGKELAARALHRLDCRRRDRPFVAVNCAAITTGLAESDLFGHRRGAFTGAERERPGLIRASHGGVLFLDEIGDLELGLQAKLLRVIQERRVMAVGDDREVPVDVRVVAATNQDLDDMVRRHAFRADLLHRLNVLTIRVPPLRDRREDIESLVEHFIAQCAVAMRDGVSASREFVEALRQLELPGNVRQLENVVRRALVASGRDDQLRLGSLPPELWIELCRAEGSPAATATAPCEPPSATAPARPDGTVLLDPVAILDAALWKLEGALALCEQQLVAAALGASHGNRSRAARLLGISPRCIFNKMRKHRLTA